jgi:hypothetical protein
MQTHAVREPSSDAGALATIRLVASFALLGAVLTGVAVGWIDHLPFDPRLVGAIVGGGLGIVAKATHTV